METHYPKKDDSHQLILGSVKWGFRFMFSNRYQWLSYEIDGRFSL